LDRLGYSQPGTPSPWGLVLSVPLATGRDTVTPSPGPLMRSSFHHRSVSRPLVHAVWAAGSDVTDDLRYLVRSAQPAVVFSSLAHLCVPMFSDACTIDIVEQGEIAYRIAYGRRDREPAAGAADGGPDWTMSVGFCSRAVDAPDLSYRGVMTHRWRYRCGSSADRARATILARHAVDIVAEERHGADPRRGHETVELLRAVRRERPVSSVRRELGCRNVMNDPSRPADQDDPDG
jgi:hypothetical protein